MSQSLLHSPAARRPEAPTCTVSGARPETDRLLREVAFVCRLTERVKEAVVGSKASLAGAAV
jgi:hypothetical protein